MAPTNPGPIERDSEFYQDILTGVSAAVDLAAAGQNSSFTLDIRGRLVPLPVTMQSIQNQLHNFNPSGGNIINISSSVTNYDPGIGGAATQVGVVGTSSGSLVIGTPVEKEATKRAIADAVWSEGIAQIDRFGTSDNNGYLEYTVATKGAPGDGPFGAAVTKTAGCAASLVGSSCICCLLE